MSAIILLLFIFTIQKEIQENVELKDLGILTLSPSYDYHIYVTDNTKTTNPIYFIIETELNTLPFDIYYTVRGTSAKINISIYHQEQKGNLNALFFKYEKENTSSLTLDFYITNIISQYAILVRSQYEESNSNFIRIEDPEKENKIQVYKNKPLILLFNSENLKSKSFQLTVPSFDSFKKQYKIFASNTDMNNTFLLGRDYTFSWETYTLYDNITYELYQKAGTVGLGGYKSQFIIFEPLVDDNLIFQIKNVSYLPYISQTPNDIGKSIIENIYYKMIIYPFDCSIYYQNLFYFTIKKLNQNTFNYFYSKGDIYQSDISVPLEFKKAACISKNNYDYCQMDRTFLEQKLFYFTIKSNVISNNNLIDVRSTFFDESNYTIHEPYSSYEYIINNNKKPNLPMVIGDFEYNDKFYFDIEITFLNNDLENNIKNIDIYVKILNQKAENYLEFRLENKDISLIKKFSTEYKAYYLYQSNDAFTSGVKSLFFFINHKGKYPNCVIKYGTYKEKPVIYKKNLMYLNQEKTVYNTYNIFFLSLNLTGNSFISNDNIYINFESKKEAFNINKIYYRFDTSKTNYDIDGDYSICDYKLKKDGDKMSISCFISNKSAKSMNFILFLNQNYDIYVNAELIYRGKFDNNLSFVPDRKYIISNDAFNEDNYYVFISSNNSDYFDINNISYNNIRNLDDFDESFPIEEYQEVKGFSDKRFYINIKNKDNKPLIGFKTGKIIIPFKIIKTKFDESNIQFINYSEKIKLNLTKDNPFIFLINFDSNYGNFYFKLSSNFNKDYFNNITYFINMKEFRTFSDIAQMKKFDENVDKIFYGEDKTVIYKQNTIYYNLYGMMINHKIEGELEFEISNTSDIYSLTLRDLIPYELKRGVNLINTNLNSYQEYIYILKQHNNLINSSNIEIYNTDYTSFNSKETFIYSVPIEYNNDNNNTYFYFNFNTRPYLIIFCDSSSKVTLRQSTKKENDIIKYYNLDESTIEIKNNNEIVLIGGIEIDNINSGNYYFKYTIDLQYYNNLNTICYIDDEENIDNIVDFYERDKNNIRPIRYIKYEDKIDIYLETYNLQSSGQKSAVFMFDYFDNYYTLFIDLKASKQSLYTYHNVNRSQNTVFDIFNKVFFIDINISDFKDDNNEFIFFEISGPLSAFNSTQIYINDINDTQSEIFNEFYYCNKNYDENELIISCNYEKSNKDSIRFMLFLNKGNKITIKNIIPDKIIIPSDEDNADGDNESNILNLFNYIGIPFIIISIVFVIIIIIIRCKKKIEISNESIENFIMN